MRFIDGLWRTGKIHDYATLTQAYARPEIALVVGIFGVNFANMYIVQLATLWLLGKYLREENSLKENGEVMYSKFGMEGWRLYYVNNRFGLLADVQNRMTEAIKEAKEHQKQVKQELATHDLGAQDNSSKEKGPPSYVSV
jgi:hypothetical protein